MKRRIVAAGLLLALAGALTPLAAELDLRHKWVWCMQNLRNPQMADEVIGLMERAKKAGYTGFVISDWTHNILDQQGESYFNNVARVKAKAAELGLDVIPTVFGFGYADGILWHDTNLIEGLPVKDAPFEVTDGKLLPRMDDETRLVNGDFDALDANGRLTGWWQEDVGESVHVDREVVKSGKASLRMQDIDTHSPTHGLCRVHQYINVKPWRYYRVSVWIRTEDFANPAAVELKVLAKRPGSLSHQYLEVKRTQEWTEHHVAFNSLDNDRVRIYCGTWGAKGGKLWWDGLRLEPGGFVNVIRRDACPVKLTSPDGKITYVEGKDVSPVVDPKLGREKWPGTYAAWHTPPEITLPEGSRLKEGDRVLASYCHPVIIYGSQVTCSLTDPKVYEIMDDQFKRVHALWGAKVYMMGYDEIRCGGWTPDYDGRDMGEWLAESVRKARAIIRKHAPDAKVLVWNDMFDPNHNAKSRGYYYLVRTPWAGSWKGLTPDIIIMDWYASQAANSMKFFHELNGHEMMMAGYYDNPNVVPNVTAWLSAAKATPAKVTGIMYTTWGGDYRDLEKFIAEVDRQAKE
ncbi:MAG TPA: carbohydrate binding domain-containing protein [Planctomycetota bacterium]|nr:carbohydrate binding domain-containing protein [Planctomycetota bacterium]